MIPELIRLNGYAYSWASIIFKVNFVPYLGLKSIDFGDSIEEELIYGSNRAGIPIARTAGKYTPGDLTVGALNGTAQTIMESLGLLGIGAISKPEVMCTLTLSEFGKPDTTYTFNRCRMVAPKDSPSEGVEGLTTDLTFKPMWIERNGLTLFDRMRMIPL
ncbi:MAG: hypothetical protein KF764_02990 [Labilithrix sp.]|nr:hypothetical protein [Labilithrix sp.]